MIDLVLAAPDLPDEPGLVAAAGGAGLQVVRRAVDAADLLAAAAADPRVALAVTAGVPRISGDLVGRVLADERAVIGLHADEADRARLLALGIRVLVPVERDAAATMLALADVLAAVPTPAEQPADTARAAAPQGSARSGRVIAVWGPAGSPGRTSTALGLAEACASRGARTCIVDADTYAPSVTLALGVLEDASGLTVACRQAENGALSQRSLLAGCHRLAGGLHVLGGIGHARRWADVREPALRQLWDLAADTFDTTIVDVGACIEHEGAVAHLPGSALLSSRRNAAATTALGAADAVLVVGRASTLGVARLLSTIAEIGDVSPGADVVVALTGEDPAQVRAATRAIDAAGLSWPVLPLVRDARRLERALRSGQGPYESAGRRERRALESLAQRLAA